ncbi:MAG: hypothetical protein WCS73_00055 [Lentisphaeria bacterium]
MMGVLRKILVGVIALAGISVMYGQGNGIPDEAADLPCLLQEVGVIPEEAAVDVLKPTFQIALCWATDYVSDGFVKTSEPVTSIDFRMDLGEFRIGTWNQYDWTNINDEKNARHNSRKNSFEECHFYGEYNHVIEDGAGIADLIIGTCFTYLIFPSAVESKMPDHLEEYSLLLKLGDVLHIEGQSLRAGTRFDYDAHLNNVYGQFDLLYCKKLWAKTSLDVIGSVFWGSPRKMRMQSGEDRGWGIRSCVLIAGISYAVTQDINISPYVGISYLPNPSVREYTRSNPNFDSNTWGGIRAAYKF